MSSHRAGLLLFAGVFLALASLTPARIAGMGYTGEELAATSQLLRGEQVSWPRNGLTAMLVHAPFVAAGMLAGRGSERWIDAAAAFEPIAATALIVALVFLWIERETADRVLALALALACAFATMLWPYAYIGLETTQAAALLAAAYLAFHPSASKPVVKALFVLCAAVAVSAKSTGILLLPAILLLVYVALLREASPRRAKLAWAAAALAILFAAIAVNAHFRGIFWAAHGGSMANLRLWSVAGPSSVALNLVAYFGSPNKGLAVFAPLAMLAIWRLPRAWRENRALALFALLALAAQAGTFSLLRVWSDETWGPRYLHSTIAPLVVLLGLASRDWRRHLRVALPAFALVVIVGFYVSMLGALFSYGTLFGKATAAGDSNLETLQGDVNWNHVRFNERLMRVWLRTQLLGSDETVWTPQRFWWFERPADAPPERAIDLRHVAVPQSIALRSFRSTPNRALQLTLAAAGLAALAIFGALARDAGRRPTPSRRERLRPVAPRPNSPAPPRTSR